LLPIAGEEEDDDEGDDEGDDDGEADEEMEEGSTIVDIALADPQFSTLVTALTEAGLVETLQGEGPFTVFAPTNAAFENLPEGVLAALIANPEALTEVLLYHVAEGIAKSSDFDKGKNEVEMLNEDEVKVVLTGSGKIKVIDEDDNSPTADVILGDVEASNGVIHVIDEVLIPEDLEL